MYSIFHTTERTLVALFAALAAISFVRPAVAQEGELPREFVEEILRNAHQMVEHPPRMLLEVEGSRETISITETGKRFHWLRKGNFITYIDGDSWRYDECLHSIKDNIPDTPPQGARTTWIKDNDKTILWSKMWSGGLEENFVQIGSPEYSMVLSYKSELEGLADPYNWLKEVCFSPDSVDFPTVESKIVSPGILKVVFAKEGMNSIKRMEIFYDESQGYLPIKAVFMYEGKNRSVDRRYEFAYEQVENRWLPKKVRVENKEEPWRPARDFHIEIQVKRVEFPKEEFSPEVFNPSFPDGTNVHDVRTGVRFVVRGPAIKDEWVDKFLGDLERAGISPPAVLPKVEGEPQVELKETRPAEKVLPEVPAPRAPGQPGGFGFWDYIGIAGVFSAGSLLIFLLLFIAAKRRGKQR